MFTQKYLRNYIPVTENRHKLQVETSLGRQHEQEPYLLEK